MERLQQATTTASVRGGQLRRSVGRRWTREELRRLRQALEDPVLDEERSSRSTLSVSAKALTTSCARNESGSEFWPISASLDP